MLIMDKKVIADIYLKHGMVYCGHAYSVDTGQDYDIDLVYDWLDNNQDQVSLYFAEQGIRWDGV